MIGMKLEAAKSNFFDSEAIKSRTTPAERRVLSKFGAHVRRTARQSIRFTKKAVSRPGQPPRSHSRDKTASIRNILFAFDPARRSVVIGPVKLNMTQGLDSVTVIAGTVPQVLEYGGRITITEKKRLGSSQWRRADMRRTPRAGEVFRKRRAVIQARPFMWPAFVKEEKDTLPGLWRNAVAA